MRVDSVVDRESNDVKGELIKGTNEGTVKGNVKIKKN